MRIKTCSVFLMMLFIGFFGVVAVQAKVSITYTSRGTQYFTMNIPDDWRVNVGSEAGNPQVPDDAKQPPRLISAMPNNGVPLWFGMWVPDALETIEDAEAYMASLQLDLLSDVVATERMFDTINSMNVYIVRGTGKKKDELMDFRAGFFQLSPGNVAIAIYIGPPKTTESHGEKLLQMIHSLRPLVQ
jgi:hypothetical protein